MSHSGGMLVRSPAFTVVRAQRRSMVLGITTSHRMLNDRKRTCHHAPLLAPASSDPAISAPRRCVSSVCPNPYVSLRLRKFRTRVGCAWLQTDLRLVLFLTARRSRAGTGLGRFSCGSVAHTSSSKSGHVVRFAFHRQRHVWAVQL